jgi:hypothetical protein
VAFAAAGGHDPSDLDKQVAAPMVPRSRHRRGKKRKAVTLTHEEEAKAASRNKAAWLALNPDCDYEALILDGFQPPPMARSPIPRTTSGPALGDSLSGPWRRSCPADR